MRDPNDFRDAFLPAIGLFTVIFIVIGARTDWGIFLILEDVLIVVVLVLKYKFWRCPYCKCSLPRREFDRIEFCPYCGKRFGKRKSRNTKINK